MSVGWRPQHMEPQRRIHGVFAGGGIKGIALAGAAAAAMEHGYRFDQVVGTSSGALVGALIVAGYEPDELREAVLEIPWPSLADPTPGATLPLIGKHVALTLNKGLNRGVALERTWRSLLRAKGVRTFGDLEPGALRVVTTDVTHQRGVVLPDDLERYGVLPERFPVARAVRMSSAVPFFFRPVRLHDLRRQDTALFVDGAIAANFPLRVAAWEDARPVFGFRFTAAADERDHREIRGPASLAAAVITAAVRAAGTLDSPLLRQASIIEIDIERDPLDFDITPAVARDLFAVGHATARAHLTRREEGLPAYVLRPDEPEGPDQATRLGSRAAG